MAVAADKCYRQPEHVVLEAQLGLALDHSAADIAARLNLSVRTVQRWRANFKAHGVAYAPRSQVLGRPRVLTVEQEKWLLQYFSEHQNTQLAELSAVMLERWGVEIDISTVSRYIHRNGCAKNRPKRRKNGMDAVSAQGPLSSSASKLERTRNVVDPRLEDASTARQFIFDPALAVASRAAISHP